MAANGAIRENYRQQRHDIIEPEEFFPVAKKPQTVRASQLAALELHSQKEVMRIGLLKCSVEFIIFSSKL